MKRTLVLALALALSTIVLAAPRRGGQASQRCPHPGGLAQLLAELPEEPLSEAERTDLVFMREEEKLARDVYMTLDETWGLRVFENISQAEQFHFDAVLVLLDKYGVDDPAGVNPRGTFVNQDLQALYDRLVVQGSESLAAALEVGALIEEIDIADLDAALDRADNQDVDTLWQNLEKGSRNHLRAFFDLLTANGVTYEPTELDAATFEEIVSSSRERGLVDAEGDLIAGCGGRGGPGRGFRGARTR